jgi:hypothetical protein
MDPESSDDELVATFTTRSGLGHIFNGDDEAIEDRVRRYRFEERFSAWRRCIEARTRRLLTKPRARRAICGVAQAFMERRTLRGREIRAAAGLSSERRGIGRGSART